MAVCVALKKSIIIEYVVLLYTFLVMAFERLDIPCGWKVTVHLGISRSAQSVCE